MIPKLPPFRESIRIISKISPLLTFYVSDLKIIKESFLEDVLSDTSDDDNSLDDVYFKNDNKNKNYDDDIDNFDVNSYLNNQNTDNINYTELNNKFWSRIYLSLNQINFSQTFCDPLKDFPLFINTLYKIKDKLDPVQKYLKSNLNQSFILKSCVNDIIKLISKYSLNSDPSFIIWDLPKALYNNNFIYLSLLLELNDTNNSIWTNFVQTPGSLNLFLDHYLPLIGPANDIVTAQLVGIIDSLFQNPSYYENIKMPKKQANSFWFKLMRIIGCSENVEVVTTAFCAAKSLYLLMTPLMQKSVKLSWLDEMINASSNGTTNNYREFYKINSDYEDKNDKKSFQIANKNRLYFNKIDEPKKIVMKYRHCPVHYQVLEFIFNLKVPNFKYVTLIKHLVHQGITSPNDLFYIQRCLMAPKVKKPFFGFKSLLNIATNDKIWSSVATKMLYEPLLRFSNLAGIQTLFSEFVKRAFIFIGVATLRQKYSRRRMMILNCFRALYCDVEIEWLNSLIIKYYAALVFSKKIKHVIPEFSLTSTKKGKKLKKDNPKVTESIKSSRSNFEIRPPSISSFNSDFEVQRPRHSPDVQSRVQYDKMFPNEVDRMAKSQINLKTFLKTSDITIPKYVNAKTKARTPPTQNNQQLLTQQQKLLLQKQKLNDRFKLQRQQMLSKFKQQKEQKMQMKPNLLMIKENNKNPLNSNIQSKLQQQQHQYLHVQKLPKSQMNQYKQSSRTKQKTPTLIQPSIKQIQQQQQKKKQKIEIQKIESFVQPIKSCEEEKDETVLDDEFKADNEDDIMDDENEIANDDDNEEDINEEDEDENENEDINNGNDEDDYINKFFTDDDDNIYAEDVDKNNDVNINAKDDDYDDNDDS